MRTIVEHFGAVVALHGVDFDVGRGSDRATVLRDGRVAGLRRIAETTPDEITGLIVGAAAARAAR